MKRRLNINKTAVTLIVFNVILVLSILGMMVYFLFRHPSRISENSLLEYVLFVFIFVIVFINSYITIKDALTLSWMDDQNQIILDSLAQQEDLNKTLRAQRHDFMNHLQVVYSLMELEEYHEAREYIDQVYQDIQKVSRVLKTANPAVNALLQAKILACDAHGIQAEVSVSTRLEDLGIPDWELCRVLGNILDNAVYALREKPVDRRIQIQIYETLKVHGFYIANNGPAIPPAELERIFEPGFSTKGEHGDGMGLAITQDIVSENSGTLQVSSSDALTFFRVEIPKGVSQDLLE